MSDRLVTVATYQDPVAAALAKNYLENEGIASVLIDEATIATDWALSGAIGGVKLQVAALHVERAEMLLERIETQRSEQAEAPLPAQTAIAREEIAEDLHAENVDKAPINKLADRLFRTAIFGLLFWPLQLYALYLLASLLTTEGQVSPDRRWKVWAATLLNVPLISVIVVPLLCLLNSFSH